MQTLADLLNTIPAIDSATMSRTQRYTGRLFEPVGSLGELKMLAMQLAEIPGLNGAPYMSKKAVLVICTDHGVWEEGVATPPREVTAVQTKNMIRGTTGVCVLAEQVGANVHVINAGIDTAEPISGLTSMCAAQDSSNIASAPAMSRRQAEKLLLGVICYTQELAKNDVTLFGVGELGVANTIPAAAIVNTITGRDPKGVVGTGASLPMDKLVNKADAVRRVITLNQPDPQDGIDVLTKISGFDLAGIAGIVLGTASRSLLVLLNGFLSYAVVLAAYQMSPATKPYLIPSHLSAERGAHIAFSHLGLEPHLDMETRLGERSGAAPAMLVIEATCAIYSNINELAASDIVLPGNTTSNPNS